ncbi:helix-turn-helix domain-containing protein [Salinimicrobium flavum]|uniref:Helix-turn-helix domain-containing protein n=1 Tax=Salinimicrobium flavum TaxID=1737065 RepID=A0ABW5IX10_9FLAO
MEQVFFTFPLAELEPIFKRWIRETQIETESKQASSETTEDILTVQEAAKFLDLAVPTVYSKVSKGELPFMKRSKRLYFSSTDLREYLKAGRRKSNSEVEQEAKALFSSTQKGLRNGK